MNLEGHSPVSGQDHGTDYKRSNGIANAGSNAVNRQGEPPAIGEPQRERSHGGRMPEGYPQADEGGGGESPAIALHGAQRKEAETEHQDAKDQYQAPVTPESVCQIPGRKQQTAPDSHLDSGYCTYLDRRQTKLLLEEGKGEREHRHIPVNGDVPAGNPAKVPEPGSACGSEGCSHGGGPVC